MDVRWRCYIGSHAQGIQCITLGSELWGVWTINEVRYRNFERHRGAGRRRGSIDRDLIRPNPHLDGLACCRIGLDGAEHAANFHFALGGASDGHRAIGFGAFGHLELTHADQGGQTDQSDQCHEHRDHDFDQADSATTVCRLAITAANRHPCSSHVIALPCSDPIGRRREGHSD